MPHVMIRRATPDDADDLARVRVAAWRAAYAGLLPDDFLTAMDVADTAARWREAFGAADHEDFVCVADGTLVGYVTLGPNRDGEGEFVGEVMAIYLAPEAWGRGWGSLMWDAALERLREMGFRRAVVWMLQGNRRAKRFYERRRLRLEARRTIKLADFEVVEHRYRLDLTSNPHRTAPVKRPALVKLARRLLHFFTAVSLLLCVTVTCGASYVGDPDADANDGSTVRWSNRSGSR